MDTIINFILDHATASLIITGIVTLGVIASIPFLKQGSYEGIRYNYQLIAKLLRTDIKRRFLMTIIDGYYKGRNIVWQCGLQENFTSDFLFHEGPQGHCIYINLNKAPKTKLFPPYPQPTKNTIFQGKRIYYYLQPDLRWEKFSEQELVSMFDELIQAAELVEKSTSWFNNFVYL